jgi:hypothetical protein
MLVRIEIPMSCQARHYASTIQTTTRSINQNYQVQSRVQVHEFDHKESRVGINACIFQHNLLLTQTLRLEASRGSYL